MKRMFRVIGTLTAALLMLASVGQADELVFAHGANPGNPRYDAAEMFGKLMSACSSGTSVNVAPSSTMGDDSEMLTSAQAGIIQMSANSQGPLAQIVPEVGMLGLPFLFKDLPNVWRVLDGEVGQMLDKKANAAGLKVITFWDNGFRQTTHTDKFVDSLAAIKGMMIRTPPDEVTTDIFKSLSATPAPLSWSELPTALQAGTFEGQENPLTNIYSAKIHTITPYITMTDHKYESTPVVASLMWWNSISKEEQACVVDSAKAAGWYQRGRSYIDSIALKKIMENEGAQFKTVDKAVFQKATEPVYAKYGKKYGSFIDTLRKAAAGN